MLVGMRCTRARLSVACCLGRKKSITSAEKGTTRRLVQQIVSRAVETEGRSLGEVQCPLAGWSTLMACSGGGMLRPEA